MTNKQLKNEFKQQAYAAVPDKCEELLKTVAAQSDRAASLSDDEDEPHLVPVVPATSQKTAERWLALAACFVVVLVAVIIAANRDDTQLTKRGVVDGGDVTTTTTAFGTVPSASGSGEISGSVSAATVSSVSQSGGTVTLSAASGTQTTNASGLPFSTGSSRISGTVSGGTTVTGSVSSGTTQKGATTSKISKKTKNPFWGDFSVSTTKKKDSGGATTQKTIAPSAKPTTKRTTAPTTKRQVNHSIVYEVPATIGGMRPLDSDLKNHILQPTEPSAVPAEPTKSPDPTTPKKDRSYNTVTLSGSDYTASVVYMSTWEMPSEDAYRIFTQIDFVDGWRITFNSVCVGKTVLYSTKNIYTDTGVCLLEQSYNPYAEILLTISRNEKGDVISRTTKNIPLGSAEFVCLYT